MAAKRFFYETCCVNAKGEDINAMVDSPKQQDVTLATIRRHCADFAQWCRDMQYCRGRLTISHDWAVNYCKSVYRGRPCYYVVHSCIEYIWTETETEA